MNIKIIEEMCKMAWGPNHPKLIWPPDMNLIKCGLLETAVFKMDLDENEEY